MSNAGKVVILRGIPGSGKSTLGKKLFPGADVCSADHFFLNEVGDYVFDGSKIAEAHRACFRKFLDLVVLGSSARPRAIIVDNTNIHLWEMAPYVLAAESYGWTVESIEVTCPVDLAFKRQTHGVPEPVLHRMAGSFEGPLLMWKASVVRGDE